MFYEIFLSTQVKQCAIITCKHGIYELPHQLPKDLFAAVGALPTQEKKT